jgi:hypothetical protein
MFPTLTAQIQGYAIYAVIHAKSTGDTDCLQAKFVQEYCVRKRLALTCPAKSEKTYKFMILPTSRFPYRSVIVPDTIVFTTEADNPDRARTTAQPVNCLTNAAGTNSRE